MGFWKSERGINGDGWADELGRCMKQLEKEKVSTGSKTYGDEEHEITLAEFADLVEFCSRGHLMVEVRNPDKDSKRPLSQLFGDPAVETYPNRGQIHCPELCNV